MKTPIFAKGDIVSYNAETEQGGRNKDNTYKVLDVYQVEGRGNVWFLQVQGNGGNAAASFISSGAPSTTFPESGWSLVKKAFTPTFERGTKVNYFSNAGTVYTIGESKVCSNGEEQAQLCVGTHNYGFYPISGMKLIEPVVVGPKKGDRIELSITAEVDSVLDGTGLTLTTKDSGAFFVAYEDINGRPTVIKPKTTPWKMGEKVQHSDRTYHVQSLLTNDWCVLLREGTIADFKLAHKNDPSFTR